jgi:hypothetical protein
MFIAKLKRANARIACGRAWRSVSRSCRQEPLKLGARNDLVTQGAGRLEQAALD